MLCHYLIICAFKLFFSLKRVEIQMAKEHLQMATVMSALKRQFLIELFVLVFFLFFILVESGLALITILRRPTHIQDNTVNILIFCLVPSAVIVVLFYLGTIIYFARMARCYVDILIEKYKFKKTRVMAVIYALALWLC